MLLVSPLHAPLLSRGLRLREQRGLEGPFRPLPQRQQLRPFAQHLLTLPHTIPRRLQRLDVILTVLTRPFLRRVVIEVLKPGLGCVGELALVIEQRRWPRPVGPLGVWRISSSRFSRRLPSRFFLHLSTTTTSAAQSTAVATTLSTVKSVVDML